MKKIMLVLAGMLSVLVLSACNNQSEEVQEDTNINTSSSESKTKNDLGETLVVYFSVPETQDPNNMTEEEENSVVVIDGKVLGNTEYVAWTIQENTGGDLFRIEPETPYPTNHDELVDLAKGEQMNNARPKLLNQIENLDTYDTIFLGYPNWWGDMPMIVYSFLDDNDLSKKRIIPFNTHGGSGFSSTIESIKNEEPDAVVESNGYSVSRDDVHNSEDEIKSWLADMQSE